MDFAQNSTAPSSFHLDMSLHTNQNIPFPWKLHEMLDACEKAGWGHIVSWLPDNASFRVHNPTFFMENVIKNFFKQTKYKSVSNCDDAENCTGCSNDGVTHANSIHFSRSHQYSTGSFKDNVSNTFHIHDKLCFFRSKLESLTLLFPSFPYHRYISKYLGLSTHHHWTKQRGILAQILYSSE